MRKKKIILAPEYFYPLEGGVEKVVENLALELKKRGYKVYIFCLNSPYFQKFIDHYKGIKVFRFYFSLPLDLKQYFLFPFLFPLTLLHLFLVFVLLGHIDIVNIHFVKNQTLYFLLLKKIFKFKLFLSFHGSDIERFIPNNRILQIISDQAVKKCDGIHTVSNYMKEKIRTNFHLKRSIAVIGNGIRMEEFSHKRSIDSNYIFAFGRFVNEKGFDLLLRAMSKIKDDYKLIIAGYGKMYRDYIKIIKNNKLGNRVKIYKNIRREKLLSLLFNSKFVIIPSRRESFGLVVLEAMIAKKAIVASQVGGLKELIIENENGLLFNINNISDISEKIKIMWSNGNLRKKCEINNFEKAKQYTWNNITKEYIKFYNNA